MKRSAELILTPKKQKKIVLLIESMPKEIWNNIISSINKKDYCSFIQFSQVNKLFLTIMRDNLFAKSTKFAREWQHRFISNPEFNNTPYNPLENLNPNNVLNARQIPLDLRLKFINYFSDNNNIITPQSINFLILGSTSQKSFGAAFVTVFRRFKKLLLDMECNFLLDQLLNLCSNEEPYVQKEAIMVLGNIFEQLTEEQKTLTITKIVELLSETNCLTRRSLDSWSFVRAVIQVLKKIFLYGTLEQKEKFIDSIIILTCNDYERMLEMGILDQIYAYLSVQQKSTVVNTIIKLYGDWEGDIDEEIESSSANIYTFLTIEHKRFFFSNINNLCINSSAFIRGNAINMLVHIYIQLSLEEQELAFTTLVHACSDEDKFHRNDAVKALLKIYAILTAEQKNRALAGIVEVYSCGSTKAAAALVYIWENLTIEQQKTVFSDADKIINLYKKRFSPTNQDKNTTAIIQNIYIHLSLEQKIEIINEIANLDTVDSLAVLGKLYVYSTLEQQKLILTKIIDLCQHDNWNIRRKVIKILGLGYAMLTIEQREIVFCNLMQLLEAEDSNITKSVVKILHVYTYLAPEKTAIVFEKIINLGKYEENINDENSKTKIEPMLQAITNCYAFFTKEQAAIAFEEIIEVHKLFEANYLSHLNYIVRRALQHIFVHLTVEQKAIAFMIIFNPSLFYEGIPNFANIYIHLTIEQQEVALTNIIESLNYCEDDRKLLSLQMLLDVSAHATVDQAKRIFAVFVRLGAEKYDLIRNEAYDAISYVSCLENFHEYFDEFINTSIKEVLFSFPYKKLMFEVPSDNAPLKTPTCNKKAM